MDIGSLQTSSNTRIQNLSGEIGTPAVATKASEIRTATSSPEQVKSSSPAQNEREPYQLSDAIQRLADFVSGAQTGITFTVDQASGEQVVRVMDKQSNEVIRQIPSEEAIQIAQALDKLQGLLVKDKA